VPFNMRHATVVSVIWKMSGLAKEISRASPRDRDELIQQFSGILRHEVARREDINSHDPVEAVIVRRCSIPIHNYTDSSSIDREPFMQVKVGQ